MSSSGVSLPGQSILVLRPASQASPIAEPPVTMEAGGPSSIVQGGNTLNTASTQPSTTRVHLEEEELCLLLRICLGNSATYVASPKTDWWRSIQTEFFELTGKQYKSCQDRVTKMTTQRRKIVAGLGTGDEENPTERSDLLDNWIEFIDDVNRSVAAKKEALRTGKDTVAALTRKRQEQAAMRLAEKRRRESPDLSDEEEDCVIIEDEDFEDFEIIDNEGVLEADVSPTTPAGLAGKRTTTPMTTRSSRATQRVVAETSRTPSTQGTASQDGRREPPKTVSRKRSKLEKQEDQMTQSITSLVDAAAGVTTVIGQLVGGSGQKDGDDVTNRRFQKVEDLIQSQAVVSERQTKTTQAMMEMLQVITTQLKP